MSVCRSRCFFSFIFSHHIPLLCCHSPSTVIEGFYFAVTVDFPGTQFSNSSAREPPSEQKEKATLSSPNTDPPFLGREGPVVMWQLTATLPGSVSATKSATTSLDQSCPMISKAGHSLLCSYLIQLTAKGCSTCRTRADAFRTFMATLPRHDSYNQKTDHQLIRLHLQLPKGADQSTHTP